MKQQFLVLNLDDTLPWQRRLLAAPHRLVDLRHLQGTKCCATPESLTAIETVLRTHRDIPLCYWGAGDYHYATLARLRTLRQPITLVLFDHHHDAAPVQGGVVTCGDWVRHALNLPWVQKVLWVSGREPERWGFRPHPRLMRIGYVMPPDRFADWVAQNVPTSSVYISVDKDVLAPQDVMTNWGAGDMPLQSLLSWLRLLSEHCWVAGADVCGEWALSPSQLVPAPQDWRAIRLNERANLAIRDALADCLGPKQTGSTGRTG